MGAQPSMQHDTAYSNCFDCSATKIHQVQVTQVRLKESSESSEQNRPDPFGSATVYGPNPYRGEKTCSRLQRSRMATPSGSLGPQVVSSVGSTNMGAPSHDPTGMTEHETAYSNCFDCSATKIHQGQFGLKESSSEQRRPDPFGSATVFEPNPNRG